ncbi:MAG TPA: histidine kinase [Chitinophagaceae bacterium]|nr:histidine kinase [Chitinophagaceae bacterium]
MKIAWYQRTWIVVLLQTAFWVLFISLPILLSPVFAHVHHPAPKRAHPGTGPWDIAVDLTMIGLFYLNAYVFMPRLLYHRTFWRFALVHTLIVVLLMTLVFPFLIFPYVMIIAMSTAYKLIGDRMRVERLVKEKENENLKTELSLLRSQVNPHFMFNVLNNMVALARKKSPDLETSLIKLSSLMRYMLYEADEDKVPLDKELEYLQSYIDLQQQRFGRNMKVVVDLNMDPGQFQIEPMLLIPFVENAFKHGTGMIEDPEISIRMEVNSDQMKFTVRNKFNPDAGDQKDRGSGIGLANVRRRLNLLYGSRQKLEISNVPPWFSVTLQIRFS